jgi:hypothetical protein
MPKLVLVIVLLASLQIIAQSKKNKKVIPAQEELKISVVASIQQDSLLLTPSVTNKSIYSFTKGNKLTCIDSAGKIVWLKQLGDKLADQPIIDKSIVLLGFINGDLTKIKNDSGEIMESVGIGDSITSNIIKINYHWQNELMIPKVSDSKSAVIFSTGKGTLHCIDMETLQEYWTNNDAQAKIKSRLTIVNDKIVFVGNDNSIYCLDTRNGLLIWRWKGNDDLIFTSKDIVSDGRYVFLLSSTKMLFTLDVILGKLEWTLEDIKLENEIGIQKDNKNIIAVSDDKQLLLVSVREQKVVNKINLPQLEQHIDIPPIEFEKKFFVAIDSTIYLADIRTNTIYNYKCEVGKITGLVPLWGRKYLLTAGNGNLLIFDPRKY